MDATKEGVRPMGYKVAVLTDADGGAGTAQVCAALGQAGHEVLALPCDASLAGKLRAARPEVAYLALGGRRGEDGAVRGLLELLGVPCVGSAAAVCRGVWDKAALAHTLAEAVGRGELGSGMPATLCLARACLDELGAADAFDLVAEFIPGGYPLCVKPARGTGAAGVRKVDGQDGLADALRAALEHDDEALVQEWVEGVELAVCVVGDLDDLQVLPAVEVVPREAAFFDGACRRDGAPVERHAPVRPASLHADRSEAEAIRSEVERTAVDAYLACGCRDLGCVDLVWDGARARVIDVNLAPDMAPGSPLPLACAAAQIEPSELLDALVRVAVERG